MAIKEGQLYFIVIFLKLFGKSIIKIDSIQKALIDRLNNQWAYSEFYLYTLRKMADKLSVAFIKQIIEFFDAAMYPVEDDIQFLLR